MSLGDEQIQLDSLAGDAATTGHTPHSVLVEGSPKVPASKPAMTRYPPSFWLAFLGLCCTGLVSALDGSIVATALPSIVASLQGADDYVWVVNVYFLTR